MAKVLLSIPDKFLTTIDEIANNEQRTRSELIREALRRYIKRNIAFDTNKINKDAELLENILD